VGLGIKFSKMFEHIFLTKVQQTVISGLVTAMELYRVLLLKAMNFKAFAGLYVIHSVTHERE